MKQVLLPFALGLALGLQALVAQPAPSQPKPKILLKVQADYLALHASGSSAAKATTWEYRLSLDRGETRTGPWTAFAAPAEDGSFKFEVPLPDWRWAKIEVRALQGNEVLASTEKTRPQHAFTMLTADRIAMLPEADRTAWTRYLEISTAHADRERDQLASECRKLNLGASKPAPSDRAEFEMESKVAASWYETDEARKLADTVLSFQTPTGAWSKSVDYKAGPRTPGTHWTTQDADGWHYCGTLDNRSTTEQIEFLARGFLATKRTDCRDAASRGLQWLLDAQFPNGGWPQVYPLEPGYHEAITLNDDAIVHAMEVVRSASIGETPFAFLEETMRKKAALAYEQAVACMLACQVEIAGQKSVWCAQHDPLSLAPVAARLKEPPSLSGAESAELLKFLMRKGPTDTQVLAAIESGVAWLEQHKITDMRKTKTESGKTDYVKDASATEVLWARFYDLENGLPIFSGAQDGKIYSTYHEMVEHNKVSYDYYTTKPRDIVSKELVKWKKRLKKESDRAK